MKLNSLNAFDASFPGHNMMIEYWQWFQTLGRSFLTFYYALAQAPAAVKNITVLACLLLVIEGAQYSATGKLTYHHFNQKPAFGPPHVPAVTPKRFYSFGKAGPSFDLKFPLYRLEELSRHELEELIIERAPAHLKSGLKKYLQLALHFSQKYQVDPFWILSIMWVESHFKPSIKSPVMASGLMQIMPDTSLWLNHLLDRTLTTELAYKLTKDPVHNVQLGTFYLRRLKRKFNGDYIHATVAYNMGPGYTKRRLRWGLPVGKKNLYLDKVKRAYRLLTSGVRRHFQNTAPLHFNTYVVERRLSFEWREIEFVTWWETSLNFDDVALNDGPMRSNIL
ncbi:MAG: lytic transglycosylase domain-containing protein [Bacteriovoracaceae bacterium]|nr:lytic transglycosylase domain-containing protein [Bacteriovoracaceae bacterium]